MNKYSIKFMYISSKRKTFKYIYADSEASAVEKFKKKYIDYDVEIIDIKEVSKVE